VCSRAHRSPWSNEYDPPLPDGTVPSTKLRKLEATANDAFDTYREMYYDGGLSSVYLWDLDDGGFAGVVLLKKGASRATVSHRAVSLMVYLWFCSLIFGRAICLLLPSCCAQH
jgi:capping protein beta